MRFLESQKTKIVLGIFVASIAGVAVGYFVQTSNSTKLDKHWKASSVPYSDSVICNLKVSASSVFENDRISIESRVEKEPMALTFVDLNTDAPTMVGNRGDKTVLGKFENGSLLYLIEKTPFGNINIFTLFRDKNIMTLSKQYELMQPFGLLMMGDCLSGV